MHYLTRSRGIQNRKLLTKSLFMLMLLMLTWIFSPVIILEKARIMSCLFASPCYVLYVKKMNHIPFDQLCIICSMSVKASNSTSTISTLIVWTKHTWKPLLISCYISPHNTYSPPQKPKPKLKLSRLTRRLISSPIQINFIYKFSFHHFYFF